MKAVLKQKARARNTSFLSCIYLKALLKLFNLLQQLHLKLLLTLVAEGLILFY
jgi:hypothetical protein